MSAKSKPKLTVELVPSTCQFSNARTMLSKKDWDKVRFISYQKANNKCEICGDIGKNQGYNHNVECHEIWEYNDTEHIQKLIGLISLCPKCHHVKHIGRSIKVGIFHECIVHISKVNLWNREKIDIHLKESFDLFEQRSKFQWKLDISILSQEPYNLIIDNNKERIFEVKKYKKKRKKKKTGAKKKTPVKSIIKKRPKRKSK